VGVIIGMDPHKRSATIEVAGDRAAVLAAGRFGTDKAGYAEMLAAGRKFADRTWAAGGCNGIGKHIAHRLVHDGETVAGVPPKLSAQVRVFATGNGRKTDPVDAHSVAMVALRSPGLVQVQAGEDLVVMGMLAGRRDELGRARTQAVSRLHRLLLELFPGGAQRFLSAQQARAMIATIKPRDLPGKTRRRLAAGLISELGAIDKKIRALQKELTGLVTARGPALLELHGIGPSSAAACSPTPATSTASPAVTSSRPGTALPRWMPRPAARNAIGSPAPATGGSTGRCTSWPSFSYGTRPKAGPATTHARPAGCHR
jgi:transposase